jgi:hypothetical protein
MNIHVCILIDCTRNDYGYIDFKKLNVEKYPKVWTKNIGIKIDKLYEKNKIKPKFFKKVLNVVIRNDLIKNVYLLTQHLQYLIDKLNQIHDDEEDKEDVARQKDLVNDILLKDSYWNTIKQTFPSLNLEMINEVWYYFNKNENDLKSYIRKILCYPGNYDILVEYRDYMRNYQIFFTKDYNTIDKVTSNKITNLVELITKLLNNWFDEIPLTRYDTPTLYNVV